MTQFNAPASTVLLCEVTNGAGQITAPVENAPNAGKYSPATQGCSVVDGDANDEKLTTGYLGGVFASAPAGSPGSQNAAATGLHTDGSNFILCDGHAKWLRGSAVSPGASPAVSPTDAPSSETTTCPDSAAGTEFSGDSHYSNGFAATFSPFRAAKKTPLRNAATSRHIRSGV